jgi:hypothetical protein
MSGRVARLVLALALVACRPAAPPTQTPAKERGESPPAPPVATAETTVAATPSGPRPTPVRPQPGAGAQDTTPIPVPTRDPKIPVAELVASSAHAGATVEVTGRCLGADPARGPGPPPSRSAWILESEGAHIYVEGPLPAGCTLTTAASNTTTFRARVFEDTLTAMGGGPGVPRRYLARIR